MNRPYVVAALLGGLVAGVLDIAFAISFAAYNGMPAVRLLQVVASGVYGKAALAGGVPMAGLGLALHFAMSTFNPTATILDLMSHTLLFGVPIAVAARRALAPAAKPA